MRGLRSEEVITKRDGPIAEPWTTEELMEDVEECCPWKEVRWDLPVKKSLIHN